VSGKRLALLTAAVAVVASQAGHLVAYWLSFGPASLAMEATGAHRYFPSLVKTGLGLAALLLVAALLVIGAGRVAGRRPLTRASSPSLVRVLAVLFSLQLALFVVQETAEALTGGSRLNSAVTLLMWGAAGQLPVSLVAAVALRWIGTRFGPALAAIRTRLARPRQRPIFAFAVRSWPLAAGAVSGPARIAFSLRRRGPPPPSF
jgi:hypothetical protein